MKMSLKTWIRLAAFLISLVVFVPAWTQQTSQSGQSGQSGSTDRTTAIGKEGPGIAWDQLSPELQQVLNGAQSNWSQLPPGRQVALVNGAKRFIAMDQDARAAAAQRFADWRS